MSSPSHLLAISLQDVSFAYGNTTVLDRISLTVKQGDFVAVIGPNGGGKTTMLRLMLGFLSPQLGTIAIFGKNPEDARQHIGYVPQFSTLKADFPASVMEMVLMGAATPKLNGNYWSANSASKKKAMRLLEVLGLDAFAKKQVNSLSGGQRQRALMARALMGRPEDTNTPFLLLLDEPTASIDPQGKYCFYEYLNTLRESLTIVVVSHDLLLAAPYFSSTVLINKTLTLLPEGKLTEEAAIKLFGLHRDSCPMGALQQVISGNDLNVAKQGYSNE